MIQQQCKIKADIMFDLLMFGKIICFLRTEWQAENQKLKNILLNRKKVKFTYI